MRGSRHRQERHKRQRHTHPLHVRVFAILMSVMFMFSGIDTRGVAEAMESYGEATRKTVALVQALDQNVSRQEVEAGSAESAVNLPATLRATVRTGARESEDSGDAAANTNANTEPVVQAPSTVSEPVEATPPAEEGKAEEQTKTTQTPTNEQSEMTEGSSSVKAEQSNSEKQDPVSAAASFVGGIFMPRVALAEEAGESGSECDQAAGQQRPAGTELLPGPDIGFMVDIVPEQ